MHSILHRKVGFMRVGNLFTGVGTCFFSIWDNLKHEVGVPFVFVKSLNGDLLM